MTIGDGRTRRDMDVDGNRGMHFRLLNCRADDERRIVILEESSKLKESAAVNAVSGFGSHVVSRTELTELRS